MNIIKGHVNEEIRNNFIYITKDIKAKEGKIMELRNVKNNLIYYMHWKGGIVLDKENTFSIGGNKFIEVNEEYFSYQFIDIKEENITKHGELIPLSPRDYKLIEDNSDYFEENLLSQISVVWNGMCFPFYLPFNEGVIWGKVKNVNGSVFMLIHEECEINIQYIGEEDETLKDSNNNGSKDTQSTELKVYFKKNVEKLFSCTDALGRIAYCTTKDGNVGVWISDNQDNSLNKNQNISGPYGTMIMNSEIKQGEKMVITQYNINSIVDDITMYTNFLKDNCEILFTPLTYTENKEMNQTDQLLLFKSFLQSQFPLILTPNFMYVYKSENYIFKVIKSPRIYSIKLPKELEFPGYGHDSSIGNDIPIHHSHDGGVNFRYNSRDKSMRYLNIPSGNINSNKSLNKHCSKIIAEHTREIALNIYKYFNNQHYQNCNLIIFPMKTNIYRYLSKLYKKTKLEISPHLTYTYINLNMLKSDGKIMKAYLKRLINNNNQGKQLFIIQGGEIVDEKNKYTINKFIKKTINCKTCFTLICYNEQIPEEMDHSIDIPRVTIPKYLSKLQLSYFPNLNIKEDQGNISLDDIINNTLNRRNDKDIPGKDFSTVCNLKNIKEEIRDMLTLRNKYHSMTSKALPIRLSTGAGLIGPSGCGKTYITSRIADEFHINVIEVHNEDILSKYIGESESKIREIFQKAKENKPSIIILDEGECIAPVRGHGSSGVTDRIVNQGLTYIDGIEEREDVFIIGISGNHSLIDKALGRPGRGDRIGLLDYPNEEEIRELFLFYLEMINISNRDEIISTVMNKLNMMKYGTCADISSIVYNAYLNCVKRDQTKIEMKDEDLLKGLEDLDKKINEDEIERYRVIREKMKNNNNMDREIEIKNGDIGNLQTFK